MRRAARVDLTHQQIVRTLRAVGCTVESLAAVGGGCPDLLVGIPPALARCMELEPRVNLLLEVKSKGGALNELQREWHARWRGGPLVTVWTPEEALAAIGVRV